jgi:hypothetical protein
MLFRVVEAHGALGSTPDRHARGVDRAPLGRSPVRARFDGDYVRHFDR